MREKFAKVVPTGVAAALSVWLYSLGHEDRRVPLLILVVVLIIAIIALIVGRHIAKTHPVFAVWLIDLWMLGILILNAAVILMTAAFGIWFSSRVLGESTAARGTAKVISGALGTALAAATTTLFSNDKDSSIWPPVLWKNLLKRDYENVFVNNSLAHDAVFDERVVGENVSDGSKINFKGWGFKARHQRARLVDQAPDSDRVTS
jgi:hypothetical protein